MQNRALLIALLLLVPVSAQDAAPDYATQIEPFFAANCHKCHGAERPKGGLRLDQRADALRGGDSTDHVLVPGKSRQSDLIARLRSTDPDLQMPPKGKRIPREQVDLIARWIDAGAPWPEKAAAASAVVPGRAVTPDQRAYWAFQPVRNPATPTVRSGNVLAVRVEAADDSAVAELRAAFPIP